MIAPHQLVVIRFDINNVLIRLGIKIERGAVAAIAVDSSAAKNGLLIGHHIIGRGGVATRIVCTTLPEVKRRIDLEVS